MQIQSTNIPYYEDGILDLYLNNYEDGYCNNFDDYITSKLLNRRIQMYRYDRNPNYYVINRFCYLFMTISESYINVLKKYYNTSSDNIARIAKDSNDTARDWWRGSQTSKYKISFVSVNGYVSKSDNANEYHYVRPIINLSGNTKTKTINGKIYLTQ